MPEGARGGPPLAFSPAFPGAGPGFAAEAASRPPGSGGEGAAGAAFVRPMRRTKMRWPSKSTAGRRAAGGTSSQRTRSGGSTRSARWPRTITSSSAPSLTTREIDVSHSSTSRVAISEGGEALQLRDDAAEGHVIMVRRSKYWPTLSSSVMPMPPCRA